MKNEVLLIPEKNDLERESIAKSWLEKGGEVLRIGKFWIKPEIANDKSLSIYGNDTFALVLSQVLNLELIAPKDQYIAEISHQWIKRKIEIVQVNDVAKLRYPIFVKPVRAKLFEAKVYSHSNELELKLSGLEGADLLIVSEEIKIEAEMRAFILEGEIIDLALYEGDGLVDDARKFIASFLVEYRMILPRTYVLDIGFNKVEGWFVIEFNSTWGAGLNNCNPNLVVDCIKAATVSSSQA